MADIKWIKIATEIFDNRKIRLIESMPEGDSIIVIWFKLLCLAGNVNDNGMVYFTQEIPYTDQMLATQFNRPLATVQLALQTFERFGMVEVVDDILKISNWAKYQNLDKMNEIREYNRLAQQKHRAMLKEAKVDVNDIVNDKSMTSQPKNKNKDIDIDIEKEKKEKESPSATPTPTKRGTKPTLDEVKAYCAERGNKVDAEKFYDFYESKDWYVGKNKMKDFKAAVRNWERSESKPKGDIVDQLTKMYAPEEYTENVEKNIQVSKKRGLRGGAE